MRSVMVAVVVVLATALHASVWLLMHEQVSPPNADGVLASISFSPINPKHDGETDKTSEAQIRSDLAAVAPYTRAVRTYSVSNGLDRVPQLASEVGLRVTLGAWINEWEEQNEREIDKAIALANQYRNIDSVVVGNEAVFRAEQLHQGNPEYDANHTVKDLIAKIQRVKREVRCRSPPPRCRMSGSNIRSWRLRSIISPSTSCPIGKAFQAQRAVDHALNAYRAAAAGLSGQAHRDRGVRLAERGAQSQGRGAEPAHPGRSDTRFRHPRRRHGHRLFDRRGVRSALEDQRRKRRSLLGNLRRRSPSEVRARRHGRGRRTFS